MTRSCLPCLILALAAACVAAPVDRPTARRLIENSPRFQEAFSVTVSQDQGLVGCQGAFNNNAAWRVLDRLGLVAAVESVDFRLGFGGRPGQKCSLFQREKAQTGEGRGWISDTTMDKEWRIPVARREFVSVTGVRDGDVPGSSVAEFQYRWAYIGEVGQRLFANATPRNGSAVFRVYDDGWRLSSLSVETTGPIRSFDAAWSMFFAQPDGVRDLWFDVPEQGTPYFLLNNRLLGALEKVTPSRNGAILTVPGVRSPVRGNAGSVAFHVGLPTTGDGRYSFHIYKVESTSGEVRTVNLNNFLAFSGQPIAKDGWRWTANLEPGDYLILHSPDRSLRQINAFAFGIE